MQSLTSASSSMERYEKQIKFKHISREEQEALATKKVAIVGVGGLGSTEAQLLARAGVGTLVLVDPDYVELSNLHRQLLYDEGDVDKLKVVVAKEKLSRINSSCKYIAHVTPITSENIDEILCDVDVVIDGLDDMYARYLINDYCMKTGKPFVHAAVAGSIGVVFNILPHKTPCLQCLYPKELVEKEMQTYDVETAGALNTAVVTVGAIAACEALKILLNKNVSEELIYVDLWKEEFQKVKVEKDTSCPTCSGIYSFLDKGGGRKVVKLARNKYFVFHDGMFGFEEFINGLKSRGYAPRYDDYIVHVAESGAIVSFLRNGDAIVKNVETDEEALGVYTRVIEMSKPLPEVRSESKTSEDSSHVEETRDEPQTTLLGSSNENVDGSDMKESDSDDGDDKEDEGGLFFPNPFQ